MPRMQSQVCQRDDPGQAHAQARRQEQRGAGGRRWHRRVLCSRRNLLEASGIC